MRRFNVMLNGSRLMMFPFYVCILICVALLMVIGQPLPAVSW